MVDDYLECGGFTTSDYQGVLEAIEIQFKIPYEQLNEMFQENLFQRESMDIEDTSDMIDGQLADYLASQEN